MEIKIRTITNKTSKNGNAYLLLETNQGMMSCWDADLFDDLYKALNKGDTLNIDVEKKGDYTTVKNIIGSAAPTQTTQTTQTTQNTPNTSNTSKDASIVAQVIVKCATKLAKGMQFDSDDALGEYLTMATKELCGAYRFALSQLQ